jgi:hypothetical protein
MAKIATISFGMTFAIHVTRFFRNYFLKGVGK